MNIIPIKDLYQYNFSLDITGGLKQYWKKTKSFSSISSPKKTNMFLYLDRVCAEYVQKDGKKKVAPAGSLIYTPEGSEYRVQFYNFEDALSNTIGINFFLFDSEKKPFVLSKDILIFNGLGVKDLVTKINTATESPLVCPAKMKAGLYEIFSLISQKENFLDPKFQVIEKGIKYMQEDSLQELSIDQVAKLCNVSSIYFRKRFKEYSGKSPSEFRLDLKTKKAKEYLVSSDVSIAEIASVLGFTDASYFCKQFKIRTGLSPLSYRNKS